MIAPPDDVARVLTPQEHYQREKARRTDTLAPVLAEAKAELERAMTTPRQILVGQGPSFPLLMGHTPRRIAIARPCANAPVCTGTVGAKSPNKECFDCRRRARRADLVRLCPDCSAEGVDTPLAPKRRYCDPHVKVRDAAQQEAWRAAGRRAKAAAKAAQRLATAS